MIVLWRRQNSRTHFHNSNRRMLCKYDSFDDDGAAELVKGRIYAAAKESENTFQSE